MKLPINYETSDWQTRRAAREQYIVIQGGKCFWCKCALSDEPPAHIAKKKINKRLFPANFFNYPLHLQHDHNTGMTEGTVHAKCNAVMWQYHGR